jgi:hypothetical protein
MSADPEHTMPTPPVVDVSYRVEGTDQTNASIAFFLTKGRIFLVMLAMFALSQLVNVTAELSRGQLISSKILR